MKRTVNSSYGPVDLQLTEESKIMATFKPSKFLPAVDVFFTLEEAGNLQDAISDLVNQADFEANQRGAT